MPISIPPCSYIIVCLTTTESEDNENRHIDVDDSAATAYNLLDVTGIYDTSANDDDDNTMIMMMQPRYGILTSF
jgi:hypothetical protein